MSSIFSQKYLVKKFKNSSRVFLRELIRLERRESQNSGHEEVFGKQKKKSGKTFFSSSRESYREEAIEVRLKSIFFLSLSINKEERNKNSNRSKMIIVGGNFSKTLCNKTRTKTKKKKQQLFCPPPKIWLSIFVLKTIFFFHLKKLFISSFVFG